MDDLYNMTWGFVPKPGCTKWKESEHPRGGVAMLLNVYSSITALDSWKDDHCTPHWMAVCIRIMGETRFVVNVYAPSAKADREFFSRCFEITFRTTLDQC